MTLMQQLPRGAPATRDDLDALEQWLGHRIDGLELRIDGLDQRIDGLAERLDGLTERTDLKTESMANVVLAALHEQIGGLSS